MISVQNSRLNGPLLHVSLAYNGDDQYLNAIVPFLQGAQAAQEQAVMFAPAARLDLVCHAMNPSTAGITFLDAADVARNPARIIPWARRLVDKQHGRPIRLVGEGMWPGRSAAEIRDFVRHEALVNVLFAEVNAMVLCAYDAAAVADSFLTDVTRTHAHVLADGEYANNPHYVDAAVVLAEKGRLLPAPACAEVLHFSRPDDVQTIRRMVHETATRLGLGTQRTLDLILAVDEAASNTVSYTYEGGTLRTWTEGEALVCEVCDTGHIASVDLAGRLRPPSADTRGRGIWIMHQLCDLVELDSTSAGTTVRLHMSLR